VLYTRVYVCVCVDGWMGKGKGKEKVRESGRKIAILGGAV